jgi:hypothetical protein
MRVSEQRYARDRRALDVATRLLDFEARTGTIRELTGLSDGCIRSLSKACGGKGGSGPRSRHRGASPRRVNLLLAKARAKDEAAALLGVCLLMGLISESPGAAPAPALDGLARAERLCDAYWTFRYLVPEACIGFEHMQLILSAAATGEELATTHCRDCRALLVVDPLSRYSALCPQCGGDEPSKQKMMDFSPMRRVAEESAAYR